MASVSRNRSYPARTPRNKRVQTTPPTAVNNRTRSALSPAVTPPTAAKNRTRSAITSASRTRNRNRTDTPGSVTSGTTRSSRRSQSTASTSATAFRGKINDKKKKRLPSILTFRRNGNGKGGVGISASSSSEETALTHKSKSELLSEFSMLMNEFPTEDTLNTTLHVACLKHYSSELIVDHLIVKGPSAISMKNAAGDLPLHSAMRDGKDGGVHDRVFDKLMRRYPEAIKHTNKEGSLPIHLACQSGGKSIYAVKKLLKEYPASVMVQSNVKMEFDIKALEHVPQTSGEDGEEDDTEKHDENVVGDIHCLPSLWSRVLPSSPSNDLDAVQESASEEGETENGFSPLHLAILHGASHDVIEAIISTNPKCIALKTSRGRRAIDIANFLNAQKTGDEEKDEGDRNEDAMKGTTSTIETLKTFELNMQKSMRLTAALNFASTRQLGGNIKDFDAKMQWRKLAHMIRFANGLKKTAPSLGPEIPYDAFKIPPPEGYEPTANLFHVCTDAQLPVGFRRLRWAMLSSKSEFVTKNLLQDKLNYSELKIEPWDKHDDEIGKGVQLKGTKLDKFVGAQRTCQYLMPKSGIVSANMAYETHTILEYSDHAFVMKKVTRNPDVPFGKTFECHVQTVVINTGNNSCRLIGSVEAVFLGKPPMIAWKIKNGMYTGVTDYFVVKGETICEHTFQQKSSQTAKE